MDLRLAVNCKSREKLKDKLLTDSPCIRNFDLTKSTTNFFKLCVQNFLRFINELKNVIYLTWKLLLL